MLNIDLARLMHRHGDEWVEMSPVEPHSPADLDPERQILRGERIFRCSDCDDEVRILPRDSAG